MTYVEDEVAYERAIRRNIRENARKGRSARWLADPANLEINDYLLGVGDFGPGGLKEDLRRGMFAGDFGEFMLKLQNDLLEWGGLSEKQADVVRKSLEKRKRWAVEREERIAARREVDKASEWIGAIKDRLDFDLMVERTMSYESQFGPFHINVARDGGGNIVVYKGSKFWAKGPRKVRATVKAHDSYEGIKQTVIARPADLAA